MKTLIVYATKYGTVSDCVKKLRENISDQATQIDIQSDPIHDLSQFDTVIIGGSIYFGALAKELRAFCIENESVLLEKNVGLFLCCAFDKDVEKHFEQNFPKVLLDKAFIRTSFGGEIHADKMSFAHKLVTKAAFKADPSSLQVADSEISRFAHSMKAVSSSRN